MTAAGQGSSGLFLYPFYVLGLPACAMTFHSFVLSRGHLSGLGTDEVGDFTVDGVYDVDRAFAFVKQYIGAHFVGQTGLSFPRLTLLP